MQAFKPERDGQDCMVEQDPGEGERKEVESFFIWETLHQGSGKGKCSGVNWLDGNDEGKGGIQAKYRNDFVEWWWH